MKKIISTITNRYHYARESIKNRYPCKIITVEYPVGHDKFAKIQYQAATKINIRTSTSKEILDDPLLVEKFHPTDGVKLGFLACGEILLNDCTTIAEARERFQLIMHKMLLSTN